MNNIKQKLAELKSIVFEAQPLGVETVDFIKKIESVLDSFKDDVIRIALMGTFSDGKTSVVAGLLEKVKSNMQIDMAESTDEISVYRFDGVNNVEIIDTPGLFGTKEKEIDGASIKFSDITKKYISECNVLVYVCNAVNPLKQSHETSIRMVLRDLGKLGATIFVLNKMDSTGVDLTDEEDYQDKVQIKKQNLIGRLRDVIGLTKEEEKNLKIVCVAADPREKGLEYWLSKVGDYRSISHLSLLKNEIDEVVNKGDVPTIKVETGLSVIRDVIINTRNDIKAVSRPIEKSLKENRDYLLDLNSEIRGLRSDLVSSMGRLSEDLHSYENMLKSGIEDCSIETLLCFMEQELGLQGETITYHHVFNKIDRLLYTHCEAKLARLEEVKNTFEQKFSMGNAVVGDALQKGAESLGKMKVNNVQVLKIREVLAKHFDWAQKIKFKPWGAVNLAKSITKWLGAAGGALTFVTEARDYIKSKKDAKRLFETKLTLKSDVTSIFLQIYDLIRDENEFFRNFAPSYLEMTELYKTRNMEIDKLQGQIDTLRRYNERLQKWSESVYVDDQTL